MWSICVDFLALALMDNTMIPTCFWRPFACWLRYAFYVCMKIPHIAECIALLSCQNNQYCLAVIGLLGFHTKSSPLFKSHPYFCLLKTLLQSSNYIKLCLWLWRQAIQRFKETSLNKRIMNRQTEDCIISFHNKTRTQHEIAPPQTFRESEMVGLIDVCNRVTPALLYTLYFGP